MPTPDDQDPVYIVFAPELRKYLVEDVGWTRWAELATEFPSFRSAHWAAEELKERTEIVKSAPIPY